MNNNTKTYEITAKKVAFFRHLRNYCSHSIIVFIFTLGVTASLFVAKSAYAETLYSTSFERPTFQVDDQLLGLDGWSTAIPPFLNPQAAIITDALARRGSQSVEVRGGDLVGSSGITAPYDAVGSYRRPLGANGVGYMISKNKRLARVDADLLLETNQPKTPGEFFSLTISARSGNSETLGEIGLSSQGIAEAFPFNSQPGAIPKFTKGIQFNKWYHITMFLDFANRTTSYLIDDYFLGTVPAPSLSNVLSRGSMVVYARPDSDSTGGLSSTRSSYTAHFDNFRVRVNGAEIEND